MLGPESNEYKWLITLVFVEPFLIDSRFFLTPRIKPQLKGLWICCYKNITTKIYCL